MAAPTFLRRADAVAHAREQGWAAFRTKPGPDDTWQVHYEPGENTGQAAADAYPHPEQVSHGEVAWVAGATGDEDPYRASVLVFTVPLEQVQAVLPDVYLDEKLSRVWVRVHGGAAMLCEPHDAARWPVFTPKVAAGPAQGAAAAGTGDRAAAPRAPRQPATPAVRSTAESPTRRVWALADAMPGATRQQVVAACVAEGINKNTAGTQYHHWTKRQQAQG